MPQESTLVAQELTLLAQELTLVPQELTLLPQKLSLLAQESTLAAKESFLLSREAAIAGPRGGSPRPQQQSNLRRRGGASPLQAGVGSPPLGPLQTWSKSQKIRSLSPNPYLCTIVHLLRRIDTIS